MNQIMLNMQCTQVTITWRGKAPASWIRGCWWVVSAMCYLPHNCVCFLDVPKDRERNPWVEGLAQPVQEAFLKDAESELRLRVRGTVFQAEKVSHTTT